MKKIYLLLLLVLSVGSMAIIYSCADGIYFRETLGTAQSPGAPVGLTVSPDRRSARLSWFEPAFAGTLPDGGGTAAITRYEISYSEQQDFSQEMKQIKTATERSDEAATFNLTGLDPNKTYYIRIRAYNNSSNAGRNVSAYTEYDNGQGGASFRTKSDATPPGAPEDLKFSNFGYDKFDVAWSPPSDSGRDDYGTPSAVTGYIVEWDTDKAFANVQRGATPPVQSLTTNQLTVSLTSLKVDTEYYVRIYAINDNNATDAVGVPLYISWDPLQLSADDIKQRGLPRTLSWETRPDTPANLSVTPASITTTEFSVTWAHSTGTNPDGLLPDGSVASFVGYELEVSRDANFTNPTRIMQNNAATQYTFTQLSPNVRWYARVRSVNNNPNANYNASLWTQEVFADTASAASKPAPLTDFKGGQAANPRNAVNVSWTPPQNAGTDASGAPSFISEYRVYYTEGPSGSTAPAFDPATTTLPYKAFPGGATSGTVDGDPATTRNVTAANGLLLPGRSYFLWLVAVNNEGLTSDALAYNEQGKAVGRDQADTASAIEPPSRVQNLDVTDSGQAAQARVTFMAGNPGQDAKGVQAAITQYLIYYVDVSTIPPPAQRNPNNQTDRQWFENDLKQQTPTSQLKQPASLNTTELIPVTPNKVYWVGVIAVNSNGAPNNRSDAEVFLYNSLSKETAPQPVAGNTFTATNPTTTGVTLTWQYDANSIGYGIFGPGGALATGPGANFSLEVSTDAGFTTLKASPVVTYPANPTGVFTTTQMVTGLDPDTTYYARIRVQNANQTRNRSAETTLGGNNAFFKTLSAAAPPSTVNNNITITAIGTSAFTVNFAAFTPGTKSDGTPESIIRYEIEATDNKADFTTGRQAPFSVTYTPTTQGGTVSQVFTPTQNNGLSGDTDYYVRVRAINNNPNNADNTSAYLYYVTAGGLATDPNAAAPVKTLSAYQPPLAPVSFTSNSNALMAGLVSNPATLAVVLTSNTTDPDAPGLDAKGMRRRYTDYEIMISEMANMTGAFTRKVSFTAGTTNDNIPIGTGANELNRGKRYYMQARLVNDINATSPTTDLAFTNEQGVNENFVVIPDVSAPQAPTTLRIADMMSSNTNLITLRVSDPPRDGTAAQGGYGRTVTGAYAKMAYYEITFYSVPTAANGFPSPLPANYTYTEVAAYRWPPAGQDLNVDDLTQVTRPGARNPQYPGTTDIRYDQIVNNRLRGTTNPALGTIYYIGVRAVNENYTAPNAPVTISTSDPQGNKYVLARIGDKKPVGQLGIHMISTTANAMFISLERIENFDRGLLGGQPAPLTRFQMKIEVSTDRNFNRTSTIISSLGGTLGTIDPTNGTFTGGWISFNATPNNAVGINVNTGSVIAIPGLEADKTYYVRSQISSDSSASTNDGDQPPTGPSVYMSNAADVYGYGSVNTAAPGAPPVWSAGSPNNSMQTDDMVEDVEYGNAGTNSTTYNRQDESKGGIHIYRKSDGPTINNAPPGNVYIRRIVGTMVTVNERTGIKSPPQPNTNITALYNAKPTPLNPNTGSTPIGPTNPNPQISGTASGTWVYFWRAPNPNPPQGELRYFTEITSVELELDRVGEIGVIINKLSGTNQKRDSQSPGGGFIGNVTLTPR